MLKSDGLRNIGLDTVEYLEVMIVEPSRIGDQEEKKVWMIRIVVLCRKYKTYYDRTHLEFVNSLRIHLR